MGAPSLEVSSYLLVQKRKSHGSYKLQEFMSLDMEINVAGL